MTKNKNVQTNHVGSFFCLIGSKSFFNIIYSKSTDCCDVEFRRLKVVLKYLFVWETTVDEEYANSSLLTLQLNQVFLNAMVTFLPDIFCMRNVSIMLNNGAWTLDQAGYIALLILIMIWKMYNSILTDTFDSWCGFCA